MFFIKNPVSFNIQSKSDTQDLVFRDTSIQLEYWHAAGGEKPAELRCVRSTRESTEEALDPALWRVQDLHQCGRLRVVELSFLGRVFTKLLRTDALMKRELELGESYLRSRAQIAPDDAQRIADERRALTKALQHERRAAEPSALTVYAQYKAIVRQEPIELWFEGPGASEVEFRMSDGTTVKKPNLASVTLHLNYV